MRRELKAARALVSGFAALVFSVSATAAITVDFDGSEVVGFNNIVADYGGGDLRTYDVDFFDGACNDIYGVCTNDVNFTFADTTEALVAFGALRLGAFNGSGGAANPSDAAPERMRGIEELTQAVIYTPVRTANGASGSVAGQRSFVQMNNWSETTEDQVYEFPSGFGGFYNSNFDSTSSPHEVYARWTEQAAVSVPAPVPMLLFAPLAIGLTAARRRKLRSR